MNSKTQSPARAQLGPKLLRPGPTWAQGDLLCSGSDLRARFKIQRVVMAPLGKIRWAQIRLNSECPETDLSKESLKLKQIQKHIFHIQQDISCTNYVRETHGVDWE